MNGNNRRDQTIRNHYAHPLVRVVRYLRHWGGVGTPVNDAAASAIVPRLFSNSPAPARRSGKGTGELMADTNILLVEDEPSISGFVRRGLMFEGYEVTVVEDGRTALDLIRDTPPDLLVLDLMLPGIDGIELTRRLRAVEEDSTTVQQFACSSKALRERD